MPTSRESAGGKNIRARASIDRHFAWRCCGTRRSRAPRAEGGDGTSTPQASSKFGCTHGPSRAVDDSDDGPAAPPSSRAVRSAREKGQAEADYAVLAIFSSTPPASRTAGVGRLDGVSGSQVLQRRERAALDGESHEESEKQQHSVYGGGERARRPVARCFESSKIKCAGCVVQAR